MNISLQIKINIFFDLIILFFTQNIKILNKTIVKIIAIIIVIILFY